MRGCVAATLTSAMALAGLAGAAHASATVDLIWIDVSETNASGNPVCLMPANRNCQPDPRSPDGGVTISSVALSDEITLGVILTAGPYGSCGAGVSVNYGDALSELNVVGFQSFTTTQPLPYLPLHLGSTTDRPPYIDNINAAAAPRVGFGIGLPPRGRAYLGTISFRKGASVNGLFEIGVGTDGPGGTDGVIDCNGHTITCETAFNSAFLNDGATFPTPTPTAVPPAPPGSVVGWGTNFVGQVAPPDAVNGVAGTATAIAAGDGHGCAIQTGTGEVVCWGADYGGRSTPPDAVNGVSGTASEIAAGDDHSCAIQAGTGVVVCWGQDDFGQATPPDAVNGVSGTATRIAGGAFHSCAIQAGTDDVVCWGEPTGSYARGQEIPPDAVNGVAGTATEIAAGRFHSCAIQMGTGAVVCWGEDYSGQSTPPDAVNGVSGSATAIAVGSLHSCAIQAGTGNVVCWGWNDDGQAMPPDAVNGTSGTATAITTGAHHSCAIQAGTGSVVCWGQPTCPYAYGQETPPDTVNGVVGTATAVAAGRSHTLAIVGLPAPTATPSATAIPTPTATPTPTPSPRPPTPSAPPDLCEQRWPVDTLVTIAKGKSAANNAKIRHVITGNIVDPGSVCPGDGACNAHRIPVCRGTTVTIAVTGSTDNANIGKGTISCDAAGCAVTSIDVTEKYRSVSADGKDIDRVTLLPVAIGPP